MIKTFNYIRKNFCAMDKYNTTNSNFEKDIIYSESVKAGKRIYYLDVRKTKKNEFYLSITESKKITSDGENSQQVSFEKHKIFLYREDFSNFIDGLSKTIRFIQEATSKQDNEETESSTLGSIPENIEKSEEPITGNSSNNEEEFSFEF